MKFIDSWGNLLPGASLHVRNQQGWTLDVADGQAPWDEPPVNDGKITVTLPRPSFYWWGETKAPSGHWILNDLAEYGQQIKWEDKIVATLYHMQVAY